MLQLTQPEEPGPPGGKGDTHSESPGIHRRHQETKAEKGAPGWGSRAGTPEATPRKQSRRFVLS